LIYLQIQKVRVAADKSGNKETIHEFQQIERRLSEGRHITKEVISSNIEHE
jgi:cell fate (sporulation/competence/biofilm development) regulator YmcA (YheA/YmcA/DUF963 family)